ncbi:MAG: A/G-specific adenine glycosylase [Desulfobulbaceae bacterium DB1]|nr:MAG: A/G-specific adenine glycosylase [Desulfobulbaceae bacterium DB1]
MTAIDQKLPPPLLAWFAENQRPLPWRQTYNPYHVWISEIMLQQTQMERVIPYFNRWIDRFPDICSLAEAKDDEILKLWEGLGYYARARNILRAAVLLSHEGNFLPDSYKKLIALPGIGPYTAGAVMSIAFNRDYPVVDANVERIFARIFNLDSPVKTAANQTFIRRQAEKMLPSGQARYFNQGLMELGALVCLPAQPLCAACPIADCCQAKKLDLVDKRPVLPAGKQSIVIEMATGILRRNGKVLIQKRRENDVWANLWEFPGGRLKTGESAEQAVIREFQEETGLRIRHAEEITRVRHVYMHYRVILHAFFCETAEKDETEPAIHAAQENRWVLFEELDQFAFPAGHRKLIDYLGKKSEGKRRISENNYRS